MAKKTKRQRIGHLKRVLAIQSKSRNQQNMVDFIRSEFERINDGSMRINEDDGNLYITKGKSDSYPCVVAHMDTVHNICDTFQIYEHGDVLFSVDTSDYSRTGIGGDDKVGIFCALEALETLPSVKLAFFRDEEIGCIGSNAANMKFFEDVSFILQADRKGYSDFVRKIGGTMLYSDKFAEAIEPMLKHYGKNECLTGGSTDVAALFRNGVGVCVANCSCGYYNPHRPGEYVVITEVIATSNLFVDIIKGVHVDGKRWEMPKFQKPAPIVRGGWNGYAGHGHNNPPSHNSYMPKLPSLHEAFHFPDKGINDRTLQEVICADCKDDITANYDDTEDGYFCTGCNEYCYLPDSKWGANGNSPNNNLIDKMLQSKRLKRNRRKK